MSIVSNTFELFSNYKNDHQKNEVPVSFVCKTQAVLFHCVVPALKGPKPKGKRLTKSEIKAAMEFLKKTSLEEFLNSSKVLIDFMEAENIPKTKRQEYWTYFKKLIKWATEQPYAITNQSTTVDNLSQNANPYIKGEIQVEDKTLNMFGKQARFKYTLGCHSEDYITFALRSQLEEYRKFLVEDRGLCDGFKSSVDANFTITNLLLGWLYREKKVLLDDLRLESIIPLLKIKPKRAEFKDVNCVVNQKTYLNEKRKLEGQSKMRSEETICLVRNFLDVYSKALPTRLNVLAAIINIAKFIYKNYTNTKIARDFEDIEIVELLRKFRRDEVNNFKLLRKSKLVKIKTGAR